MIKHMGGIHELEYYFFFFFLVEISGVVFTHLRETSTEIIFDAVNTITRRRAEIRRVTILMDTKKPKTLFTTNWTGIYVTT